MAQKIKSKEILGVGFLKKHAVDILFAGLCIVLALYYLNFISLLHVPSHDGAAYLLNAHEWLANEPLTEPYRPQLISWIIMGIWVITGSENWEFVKGLQPIFTIGSGIVLYILLRKYKGSLFAFSVTALTMTNTTLLYFSTQIMTEGMALFFLVLTLFFLKSQKKSYWFLAGIAIGLTFASRYPIALQAIVIFIVESMVNRNPKLIIRTILGIIISFVIVILVIQAKAGTFETALAKDRAFTLLLSPYYLINSISIWGFAFLLVPIALLLPRTYRDSFNYAFIAWFIVSILFWSASSGNWQFRFAIQFTPAVYFLSILAIENIVKSRINRKSPYLYLITVRSFLKSLKHEFRYHILGEID